MKTQRITQAMKKYNVYVNNKLVKIYKYQIQAVIYCFLNGYVTSGRGLYFLNPKVEIKITNK